MGHYSSFIVRLWVEPSDGLRWGLIKHVASRDKRRFSSLEEMLEFISQHSNVDEHSLPFTLDGSDLPEGAPSLSVFVEDDGDPEKPS